MPVVPGTVDLAVEIDHLIRRRGVTAAEDQQLNPIGLGRRHREIHPLRGDGAAQGPRSASQDCTHKTACRLQWFQSSG